MNLASRINFKFSSYLQKLYQQSKVTKTPFFTINSLACRIIEDPLDFYAVLQNSISNSSQKIGLSCLYLSTGPLQRHLLNRIAQRHKLCPNLSSSLVFDLHRSSRVTAGQSPKEMIENWAESVGSQTSISFQKIGFGKGSLGQLLGVHHQKIYIFDDRVVLSGANLEKNYFLNRRDRALLIDSPQLSDYLYQYLQILADNPKESDLLTHYRLWKYGHMPPTYCETFKEQVQFLKQKQEERKEQIKRSFSWQKAEKNVVFSKNVQIAKELGTSVTEYNQIPLKQFQRKRQKVRQKLFRVKNQDYVGNEIFQVEDGFWNAPIKAGKDIYLFPFIQWGKLGEKEENNIFSQILRLAVSKGHQIKLSSGYLNLDQSLFEELSTKCQKDYAIKLLCSAPQANSFYRAKGPKGLVPYMYRLYQLQLLKKLGKKVQIKEFFNGSWSYHAKGVWIEEAQNSVLTIIGSSNFNERSRNRDSQFQFYIYSSCEDFNGRLKSEWNELQKNCKSISEEQIEKDDDIKISWWHRWLSKAISSIL